jgi:hypothetical protein
MVCEANKQSKREARTNKTAMWSDPSSSHEAKETTEQICQQANKHRIHTSNEAVTESASRRRDKSTQNLTTGNQLVKQPLNHNRTKTSFTINQTSKQS